MFIEYPRAGSTTLFVQQLRHEGVTSKSWKVQSGKDRVGKPIDKGALYKILNNPVYLGQIRHKDVAHPGEHEPIVTLVQWETGQAALASKPNGARKGQIRTERPALLKGLIYTTDGRAMTPMPPRGVAGVCTATTTTTTTVHENIYINTVVCDHVTVMFFGDWHGTTDRAIGVEVELRAQGDAQRSSCRIPDDRMVSCETDAGAPGTTPS